MPLRILKKGNRLKICIIKNNMILLYQVKELTYTLIFNLKDYEKYKNKKN